MKELVAFSLSFRPTVCDRNAGGVRRYLGVVGIDTTAALQHQQPADAAAEADDPELVEARAACSQPGLSAQQIAVCMQHPGNLRSVSEGARRGIQECQYQFRNERWNCTTTDEQSVFGYILERGGRAAWRREQRNSRGRGGLAPLIRAALIVLAVAAAGAGLPSSSSRAVNRALAHGGCGGAAESLQWQQLFPRAVFPPRSKSNMRAMFKHGGLEEPRDEKEHFRCALKPLNIKMFLAWQVQSVESKRGCAPVTCRQ
ncbi:Protein Wnt [Gryllus bimaculatus]|nr:Protein Wnt [Gryllus bimaculatus]